MAEHSDDERAAMRSSFLALRGEDVIPRGITKLSGNAVLELWDAPRTEINNGSARVTFHHDRQIQDQRAKLVFSLLHAWGLAAASQTLVASATEENLPVPHPEPAALASYAVALVDAAWDELRRQHWIIDAPSYSELKE